MVILLFIPVAYGTDEYSCKGKLREKKNSRTPSSLEKKTHALPKDFPKLFPKRTKHSCKRFRRKIFSDGQFEQKICSLRIPTPNPASSPNYFLMVPSLNAVQFHYLVPPAEMSRGLEITKLLSSYIYLCSVKRNTVLPTAQVG